MPKNTPIRRVNRAHFHGRRALESWNSCLALLRDLAHEPGYAGPDIEVCERIGELIAETQWLISAEVVRRAPRRRAARLVAEAFAGTQR